MAGRNLRLKPRIETAGLHRYDEQPNRTVNSAHRLFAEGARETEAARLQDLRQRTVLGKRPVRDLPMEDYDSQSHRQTQHFQGDIHGAVIVDGEAGTLNQGKRLVGRTNPPASARLLR